LEFGPDGVCLLTIRAFHHPVLGSPRHSLPTLFGIDSARQGSSKKHALALVMGDSLILLFIKVPRKKKKKKKRLS
jgi:hypothetical protein